MDKLVHNHSNLIKINSIIIKSLKYKQSKNKIKFKIKNNGIKMNRCLLN